MKVSRFEELEIWQLAGELCRIIFIHTSREPFSSDYRFKDQIRAAAGSAMDAIAEGFESAGNREFAQFLFISKSSCAEVRSQAYRAFDQKYITEDQFNELMKRTETLSRKTANLIKSLKNSGFKGSKFVYNSTPNHLEPGTLNPEP